MKKIMVSLATASLIAGSAMAADKGVDIVTTGQAVIYYETSAGNGSTKEDLLSQSNSQANVGIQLNLGADLGNSFTFGSQLSYLGTTGLEKNLVSNTRQSVTAVTAMNDISDEIALTKIFIAKQIGNTTLKIGRQELPKSLSPLAFSEGWNVFKNTFEAALAINTDIPDTVVVGAWVGQSNNSLGGNFATFNDLKAGGTPATIGGGAYMLTVQNKSIPMTTLTGSYYHLVHAEIAGDPTTDLNGADAYWIDAKIAGKSMPLGLNLGLQAGSIMTDHDALADTSAMGAKLGMKVGAVSAQLAYTTVDGDDEKINVAIKNTGTGVKTPLFTQMIYNQNAIAVDADTIMAKVVYNTGDYGKIIAQYASTTAGKSNLQNGSNEDGTDYAELDLIYKIKAGGVQYFAAYMNRTFDEGGSVLAVTDSDASSEDVVRVWARYAF